jgi:hypothetical protein
MKPDLELDLFKSDTIREKCKTSRVYAQNLYAAMSNNRFFYNEAEWTCSWRMSGGIVADLVGEGESYLDYYCSGMASVDGYVSEGHVTEEIRLDLMKLGWIVKPYEQRLEPGIYRNTGK